MRVRGGNSDQVGERKRGRCWPRSVSPDVGSGGLIEIDEAQKGDCQKYFADCIFSKIDISPCIALTHL